MSFVALRRAVFKEGNVYISWCSNPGCSKHRERNRLVHDRIFSPTYPFDFTDRSVADVFPDPRVRLCSCARAVMCALADTEESFVNFIEETGDLGALCRSVSHIW